MSSEEISEKNFRYCVIRFILPFKDDNVKFVENDKIKIDNEFKFICDYIIELYNGEITINFSRDFLEIIFKNKLEYKGKFLFKKITKEMFKLVEDYILLKISKNKLFKKLLIENYEYNDKFSVDLFIQQKENILNEFVHDYIFFSRAFPRDPIKVYTF